MVEGVRDPRREGSRFPPQRLGRIRAVRLVRALLGLLAVFCAFAPQPSAADHEFGPAQARALIPEAAGVSVERYSDLKRLGAILREEDLRRGGSTPLTLAVLGYRPWWPTGDEARDRQRARDFRCVLGTGATLTDFSFAVGAGPPKPTRAFVSLLLPDTIRDVTCERAGTKAHGQVTYRSTETLGIPKEPLYEGALLWAATQGPKGWAIDEFRLPGCRFGVRLVGGAWEPFDEERPGLPVRIRTAALLATPPSVLPVVEGAASRGTVPRAIEYALAADGALFDAVAEAMDFESLARDLRLHFALRGIQARDVGFAGDVILRVAHHTPWDAAAWVLEALADPRVEADRLHFAVQPEKGGEDGVLPSFLPKDGARGEDAPRTPRSTLVLRLAPHARSVAAASGRAFLAERLAKTPGALVVIRADAGLAAGHVIRVVDWSRRAGAEDVAFAKPSSPRPTGHTTVPDSGPRTWWTPIMAHVAAHPIREWGFSLASGDATLVGDEAPLAPPSASPANEPK
jgi:hypothetical protein